MFDVVAGADITEDLQRFGRSLCGVDARPVVVRPASAADKTTFAFKVWDADAARGADLTRTHALVDLSCAGVVLVPEEVRVLRRAYIASRLATRGERTKLPGGYTYGTIDRAIRDARGILAIHRSLVGGAAAALLLLDREGGRTLGPDARAVLSEAGTRASLFAALAMLLVPEGADVSYSTVRRAYDALTGKQIDWKLLQVVRSVLGRGLRVAA